MPAAVMHRLILGVLLAAAAAVAAAWLLAPPPAASAVPPTFTPTWPVVRGAFHVHSERSDGTGTLDEIAAAAARAGLHFVVVTDHGDGTRAPEPAAYRSGVLILDGVEISTAHGHYAAIGMRQTPYSLGGTARAVIEDVRRFGGVGFVTHPGSPKPGLRWQAWDAPFDGLEWLNADSEWRDEFWGSLGRVLLTYALRPVETVSGMLDRPAPVLAAWDRAATERRVPAVAGADAHARLGFRQATDPYEDRVLARLPAYEVSFGAFVNQVVLDRPLSGDADADADAIVRALAEGRVWTAITGHAGLRAFEARAVSGAQVARPGEYLDLEGPAVLEAQIAAPEGTTLVVVRNGATLYERRGTSLRLDIGHEPGVYRIEVYLPEEMRRSSVPWVLTNPFYVGLRERHAAAASSSSPAAEPAMRTGIATDAWRAEASPGSTSRLRQTRLEDGTPALEWTFALAEGPRAGQYAAMRFPVDGEIAAHDRVLLRAMSDGARRLWIQLRAPGAAEGERWGQSFFVGETLEAVTLRFDEFEPIGPARSAQPPLGAIDSLLLVVDTLNTPPGTSGRVLIPDLWMAK